MIRPCVGSFIAAAAVFTLTAYGRADEAGYDLRTVYHNGDVYEVRAFTEYDGSGTLQMTGKPEMPFKRRFGRREQYAERVLTAKNDHRTKVRRFYLSARDFASDEGGGAKETETRVSLEGKTLLLSRGANGGTEIDVVNGDPIRDLMPSDHDDLLEELNDQEAAIVPARRLKPGDEWDVPANVAAAFLGDREESKPRMKCRFAEIKTHEGERCARIAVGVKWEAADANGKGSFALRGDIFHALNRSRFVAMDVSGPYTLVQKSSREGLNMSARGTYRLRRVARWREIDGKPVAPKQLAGHNP